MTRLIVWRHGNTDWNAANRVQGQTDVELNALGRQQAVDAAEILVKLKPDAIVASDLKRASDTAAALGALTGLSIGYDKRLRERWFGAWQGLTMPEVAERHPEQHARWTAGQEVGGDVETLEDLGKRVADGLRDAAAEAPAGGTVVVATHGAAARQGIGHLLGWPVEQLRTLRALQNCHWVELTRDDKRGWQLAAYNVGPFSDRPVPPPV
ncbi:phosphoglycerate mutase [Paractinoplanes abujensis]|uniref:Putative phosphoglycerate mutase n=1 Tax=Paractinoplanes abujensis TaxID=882441 RepID=A0A7W7CU71_9ACTN|nr:histidine phosphatase family protein [Actinoplanes abujensis]MBB4694753.1 putative phosphoglycerate mutase [Actinoplanes abujensis]GID20035.1 phosphoglycerate mutase [Actinoplanes abujensis]